MELCNNGHDEVCFESRECPACSVREESEDYIKELDDTIDDLENVIKELEDDNND